MRRLEIGNMGRKWRIQFWKAQEGDNLLAVLHYATSHKTSGFKKDLGKRESKLQIQGCSFVFLSVMTEAAAYFREHPGPLLHKGSERWVCQASPCIPATGQQAQRHHREMET